MSTGALIFAFNNEETDYIAMAEWNAYNIRQHLNIPVALVTDNETAGRNPAFDRVIKALPAKGGTRYFEDYKATVTWNNAGRTDAYNLTPWDQTLVLDADYVVASDALKPILTSPQDFLAFRKSFNIANPDADFCDSFGRYKFPMWWATVMMFRKSNTAQYIFDCMHMIRTNWQHYRDLYAISETNYRNDYALSIALGIINGHTLTVDSIPWGMPAVLPEHKLMRNSSMWTIEYTSVDGKLKQIGLAGTDFHAMGKKDLGEIVEQDRRTRLCDNGVEHAQG